MTYSQRSLYLIPCQSDSITNGVIATGPIASFPLHQDGKEAMVIVYTNRTHTSNHKFEEVKLTHSILCAA